MIVERCRRVDHVLAASWTKHWFGQFVDKRFEWRNFLDHSIATESSTRLAENIAGLAAQTFCAMKIHGYFLRTGVMGVGVIGSGAAGTLIRAPDASGAAEVPIWLPMFVVFETG